MSRPLDRAAEWLCIALLLLTGLTPAQGFVVCIEDDGCVSIEVKSTGADCGGCEGHEQRDAPSDAALTLPVDLACPCIDIAVPGSPDEQLAPKRSFDVAVGAWIAPLVEVRIEEAPAAWIAGRGPPRSPPRVAGSLAHIRSVVLLV